MLEHLFKFVLSLVFIVLAVPIVIVMLLAAFVLNCKRDLVKCFKRKTL